MTTEMFYECITNHLDTVFTDTELDTECLFTMKEDVDDDAYSMTYPTFKGAITNSKPYNFFNKSIERENKLCPPDKTKTLNLYQFLLGIFNFEGTVKTAVKKCQALEIIQYYLENDFCFNIKISQIDINKCDLMCMCYISSLLQEQEYSSEDLPTIDIENVKVIDEGEAEFTIKSEHK